MKKILILCDGLDGGIFEYSKFLKKELSGDLKIDFLFHRKRGIFGKLNFYKKVICRLINKKNLIVDIQGLIWPINLLIIPILKLRGHKIIFEAHDDPLTTRTKLRPMFIRKIILSSSDLIIAHSKYCKKILEGMGYNNVHYIPLGFTIEKTKFKKLLTMENFGIDRKYKIILFFGIISIDKGLDVLLNSVPLLEKKYKNFKIIIAGKPRDDWSFYQNIIDKLGIENKIITDLDFLPWRKVFSYFNICDVIVTPYREITNSMTPFLAYSFKKPVIATNVGAFAEIIDHNKSGLLVRNENVNELSDAILKLLKNQKMCKKFGKFGFRKLKDEFSWKRIKDDYKKVFLTKL